jgi:hypothetical protein
LEAAVVIELQCGPHLHLVGSIEAANGSWLGDGDKQCGKEHVQA